MVMRLRLSDCTKAGFAGAMLAVLLLGASGHAFGQQAPPPELLAAAPSSDVPNQSPREIGLIQKLLATLAAENGDDPTAIIGRFQLSNEYRNLTGGRLWDILTPRVDIPLSPSWLLRVDMPFRWADPNLNSGATFVGTSDMFVRTDWRFVDTPGYRLVVGSDFIFPTASNDNLGNGKYQVAPIVAVSLSLTGIKSVLTSYVENFKSVGGDPSRSDIDRGRLRTQLDILWSERWWTLLRSTLNVDWNRHAKSGMTLDLEMGRRIGNNWRVYGFPGVGLWGNDVQTNYEWKIEVGVRYMFYVF